MTKHGAQYSTHDKIRNSKVLDTTEPGILVQNMTKAGCPDLNMTKPGSQYCKHDKPQNLGTTPRLEILGKCDSWSYLCNG